MARKIDLNTWTRRYKRVLEAYGYSEENIEHNLQYRGYRAHQAGVNPEMAASELLIEDGKMKL